jgi:hypothetical protein
MPGMTDPSDALLAFQRQLSAGALPLQPCTVPELFVLVDHPSGRARFSYLAIDGRTVKAIVMLAHNGQEGGLPCFQLGYAVAKQYRRKGLAGRVVSQAINELQQGFARAGHPEVFVEAVVGHDNEASNRICEGEFPDAPEQITDSFSGEPALRYLKKVSRR